MFKSNCHTHTNYCDGKNTAREMIEAAIENGFVSLGFSSHSPMKDENEWTMKTLEVKVYIDEIHRLKNEYKDKIDILCGIELDADYEGVDLSDFDYVIGSVHQFKKDEKAYDIDYTAERLKLAVDDIFNGSFNEMSSFYYKTLADFIIETDVDVVGHIDLITKFNLDIPLFDENDAQYRQFVCNAVDRILQAKPDVVFEVNTGAMFRVGKKEPYPAAFILEHIKNKGGKITLTSDAHCCEALDFAYDKAVEFCKAAGFDEVLYITSKGWKAYKL